MRENKIVTLFFTDAQVVIAENSYTVRKLQEEYKQASPNMNMTKCESLSVETDKTCL